MKLVIGRLVPYARAMKNCSGAAAIEYSIIAGGIAVIIIVAVGMVGGSLLDLFNSVVAALGGVFPDPCDKGGANCGN